jgi:hypothetical protein
MPDTDFERECQIVGMYIDSAKSYSQLATGALALAAVFGQTKLQDLSKGLLIACVFFLIAALAGGAYQSLAVGRLENFSGLPVDRRPSRTSRPVPHSWYDNAYVFYNIMAGAFHIGAITLAVVAIARLCR